jgi:class 3 adenylate cyclase
VTADDTEPDEIVLDLAPAGIRLTVSQRTGADRVVLTVRPFESLQVDPYIQVILFSDLEGHTQMMTRLGDVAGRAILRTHERITRQALSDFGGREVKTLGDGFVATFTSAQRALRSAAALQSQFRDAEGAGNDLAGLRVRVGINAGEPEEEDGDIFGQSVIAAARIAALAQGGQVLVADVVRQLVAGKRFDFVDFGEHILKGFPEPTQIWEFSWER